MKKILIFCVAVMIMFSFVAMSDVFAANQNNTGYWKLDKTEINKDESVTEDMVRANETIIAHSYEIHPGGGSMSTTIKDGEGSVTVSSSHAFSVPEMLVPGESATIQISVVDAGSSNSHYYISHSTEASVWVNNGGWYTLIEPLVAATQTFVVAENPDASMMKAEKSVDFTVPKKAEGFTVHFKIMGGAAPGPMVINYDYIYIESGAPVPPQAGVSAAPIPSGIPEPSSGTAADTAELPVHTEQHKSPDDYENYIDYLDETGLLEYIDMDAGCRFSDLSGQVEVFVVDRDDPEGGYWELANIDTVLRPGMQVRTSWDSAAVLSFSDMSTFVMKPRTTIILDTPIHKDNKLILAAGNIWANIKKMVKDGSMEIELSQAVAGIKGTILVCEDDGQTSTLKVIEGSVVFTDRTTGEQSTVSGGEMISAGTGETPIMSFDVKREYEEWKAYAPGLEISNKTASPLVYVIVVAAVLLVLTLVVVLVITRRKRSAGMSDRYQTAQPYSQPIQGMMYCANCGKQITAGMAFCPHCGRKAI